MLRAPGKGVAKDLKRCVPNFFVDYAPVHVHNLEFKEHTVLNRGEWCKSTVPNRGEWCKSAH